MSSASIATVAFNYKIVKKLAQLNMNLVILYFYENDVDF